MVRKTTCNHSGPESYSSETVAANGKNIPSVL